MSNPITLKIEKPAKEKLNAMKKKERFSSFGVAIETMCSFFELNKISPKDGLNTNYQNSIFNVEKSVKTGLSEMKKQQNKDSQSLRKLVRALEKDHLLNTSSKVSYLYNKFKEEDAIKNTSDSLNSMLKSSDNDLKKDREIEVLKATISAKEDEINNLKNAKENQDNLLSKYEENLKAIYANYDLDKKGKIHIDMELKFFQSLFEI